MPKSILINSDTFEAICKKQESCSTCPLLLGRIIEDDDTYDYHARKICAKEYQENIITCMSALIEEAQKKSKEYELDEEDWNSNQKESK